MKKFTIADAHCDTITKYPDNPYHTDEAMWTKDSFRNVGGDFQIFAIFTPPNKHGSEATSFAVKHCGLFSRTHGNEQITFVKDADSLETSGMKIMLSIEGATPIQDDIDLLYSFYDLGVRAMGLTWNHRNMLADGIDNDYGLTGFGKEVVKEMEKLGMMIDVSHLNIAGFKDVFDTVSCPIAATHSNARSMREHKRNLEDWQIKEIIDRKGFMGLNFYTEFVNGVELAEHRNIEKAKQESVETLVKHTEHILNLGGENILGFGADYDGIRDGTYESPQGYVDFLEILQKKIGLSDIQLEKISHINLKNMVKRVI